MTDQLIPGVGAGSLLESELLADDRSTRIGAVYRIDYGEAIVLTHDRWKFDAGGIPQYSFLLATARDVHTEHPDDDEVLLFRVEGTAPAASLASSPSFLFATSRRTSVPMPMGNAAFPAPVAATALQPAGGRP